MRPSNSATIPRCAGSRSSSAAQAVAASSRRPATRCDGSACIRPCPCARRCGAARMRSACHRASRHYADVSQTDLRDLPRVHAAGAGAVAGRGVPRRHGERLSARRRDAHRPRDQAAGARANGAHGVGRRRAEQAGGQDRLRPAQARRSRGRATGRSPRAARSAADPQAVRARRENGAQGRGARHPYAGRPACRQRVAAAAGLRTLHGARPAAGRRDRRSPGDSRLGRKADQRRGDLRDRRRGPPAPAGRGRSPGGQGLHAPARQGTGPRAASP